MVKDWGMSEKIGLRTMVENPKSFQGETLGPSTNEMVSQDVFKVSLSSSFCGNKLRNNGQFDDHILNGIN